MSLPANQKADETFSAFLAVLKTRLGYANLQQAADILAQSNEVSDRHAHFARLGELLCADPLDLPAIKAAIAGRGSLFAGFGGLMARVNNFFQSEQAVQAAALIRNLVGDCTTAPAASQIDTFILEAGELTFHNKDNRPTPADAALFASVLLTAVFPADFVDFRQNRWSYLADKFGLEPMPTGAGYGELLWWGGRVAGQLAGTPTFQRYFKTDRRAWTAAGLAWQLFQHEEMKEIMDTVTTTGGPQPRIWKISPGGFGRDWPAFQTHNLIGIGFPDYWPDDLAQFNEYDDLLSAIKQRAKKEGKTKYAADQLWTIRGEMRAGDIILAYASKAIIGLGRVTGPYQFEGDKTFGYPHQRPVAWEDGFSQRSITSLSPGLQKKLMKQQTIIPLTAEEHQEIMDGVGPGPGPQPVNLLQALSGYYESKGYRLSPKLLATFVTALQTKGFVILSGLSGTGKTKLAQLLADLLPGPADTSATLPNHIFVPVRPDWRDSKSLLGFYNPLTGAYDDTRFLQFLIQAKTHYDAEGAEAVPHFVILDEMNLARVEYYFADFLSVLESGRGDDGYTGEAIPLHHHPPETTLDSLGRPIPQHITLPPNLYLIGTVNMDETTHAFSPKVLDRAFTIEFNEVDFKNYPAQAQGGFDGPQKAGLQQALLIDFQRGGKFARIDKDEIAEVVWQDGWGYRDHLQSLNKTLFSYELHFGYRVFDEIAQFMVIAGQGGLFETSEAAFDVAVLMKVLPKFNGPRSRLRRPLEAVIAWARNPEVPGDETLAGKLNDADSCRELLKQATGEFAYPETARKALRMLIRLHETGFASFA